MVLNAACGLYVAQKVKNIAQGIKLAGGSIDAGQALDKLEALKEFTHSAL